MVPLLIFSKTKLEKQTHCFLLLEPNTMTPFFDIILEYTRKENKGKNTEYTISKTTPELLPRYSFAIFQWLRTPTPGLKNSFILLKIETIISKGTIFNSSIDMEGKKKVFGQSDVK